MHSNKSEFHRPAFSQLLAPLLLAIICLFGSLLPSEAHAITKAKDFRITPYLFFGNHTDPATAASERCAFDHGVFGGSKTPDKLTIDFWNPGLPGYRLTCYWAGFNNNASNADGFYFMTTWLTAVCANGTVYNHPKDQSGTNLPLQPDSHCRSTIKLCSYNSWADNGNNTCNSPEDKNLGPCTDCRPGSKPPVETALVENPINAATGGKYQRETDYTGDLTFTRHYNSQSLTDTGLGKGWTSITQQSLTIDTSQQLNGLAGILLRQESGRSEWFECQSNGTCVGDADSALTLTKDATGYTLILKDGGSERYDITGKLLTQTDRAGNITSYTYTDGKLSSIKSPHGHTLTFTYQGNRLSTLTDSANFVIGYSYDANGNLATVSYPDGSAKLYHYETPGFPNHLTGISHIDANGNTTRYATYGYTQGKATLTEHDGGMEKATLTFDLPTQTTVTDAVGNKEIMTFATTLGVKNLVSKKNQADNKALAQVFDGNNNLICKKDEEGKVTTYTYNSTNQRLSEIVGLTGTCAAPQSTNAKRTTSYEYLSPTLDLPTLIEAPSVSPGNRKKTEITYENSLPIRITQRGYTPEGIPISRTVQLAYNNGKVSRIDGPRIDVNDITTLSYYDCATGGACGQLKTITNALGQVTSFDSYYADGRLAQTTDPNGLKTTYVYDPRGRIAKISQTPIGSGRVTEYRYTAAGDLALVAFPDGRTLTYQYSAARKLIRVTDNVGNHITYKYDLKGNRTVESTFDVSGTLIRKVEQTFDARNHLSSIDAAGSLTQQIHDAVGNLTKNTDPRNNPTQHQYDALNRLIQTVNSLGGITDYGYDTNDRLNNVVAPNGATTKYQYDDLGNLLKENSPDRGETKYSYDEAGNLKSMTDARNITLHYSYDALNRVIRVDAPGTEQDIAFTYDNSTSGTCTAGIGRLCEVNYTSGTSQFAYDAFGNVITHAQTELGKNYATSYTYDAADRITSITYPDGRVVSYTRDTLGKIQTITVTVNGITQTIASSRTYRADGLLAKQTFGNNLNEDRQYDLQGRLIYQFLGTIDTRIYGYDSNSNLKRKDSLPELADYHYDALDRLIKTERGGGVDEYGYDPNGNRKSDVRGSYAYATATNRLIQTPQGGVTLDQAGNLIQDAAGRSFTYNATGHLGSVSQAGTLLASYQYNHLRQRTRKTTPQGSIVFHYDLHGHLIQETDATGKALRTYVWADDVPVAQYTAQLDPRPLPGTHGNGKAKGAAAVQAHRPPMPEQSNRPGSTSTDGSTNETLVYLHTDHLGTPRLATDVNGIKVWSWEGEAFGNTVPDEDPDGDGKRTVFNFRYPGQYADGETRLYYNWNRHYDPRTGRYITSDPIGLRGGLNTYAYAMDNPLKFIDPKGLSSLGFDGPTGQLCLYDKNGVRVFCCNAANNIDSGVKSNFPNGHWPSGNFPFSYHKPHPGDPNGSYGSYGNLVFNVPGHEGMGVHSGQKDNPDGAGRKGPGHATLGCIRTTDDCMQKIVNFIHNDPLTDITVGW